MVNDRARAYNTVYSECYGCSSNRSDYELILGMLSQRGYALSDNIENSDLILINTCGVKEATEARMAWRIHQLSKIGKPLIIAGCLPRINLNKIRKAAPHFSAVMDPYSIDKISTAVETSLNGTTGVQYFCDNPIPKNKLPKHRLNKYVEVIQISEGCRGHCAYCCTRLARKGLWSYPLNDLVERVERAVSEKVKEIHLTAQDIGTYGLDVGSSIIKLLKELIKVPGNFKLRLGMLNPNYATEYIDDLLEIYKCNKVYRFIHLPIQSGSDYILEHMQRKYTVQEFENTVKKLRNTIDDITLSTDLIVGYPEEKDEDFKKTLDMVKLIKPDIVNISRYGHRPGTPASRLDLLSTKIVAWRSRLLSTVCSKISFERNLSMIGQQINVLFTETNTKGSYIGRSDNYRKVIVDLPVHESIFGRSQSIIIKNCTPRYLIGAISQ